MKKKEKVNVRKKVQKKKKKSMLGSPTKGKDLKDLTVEEFMLGDFSDGSDSDSKGLEETDENQVKGNTTAKLEENDSELSEGESGGSGKEEEDEPGNVEGIENEEVTETNVSHVDTEGETKKKSFTAEHKQSLDKLKQTDPEFYQFLQDNDQKLLQFDDSESEDDENKQDQIHRPLEKLEVASDDSEYEEEETEVDGRKKTNRVSMAVIGRWQETLLEDKTFKTVEEVIEAFHAAVDQMVISEEEKSSVKKYNIKDGTVFNGIIRLCILDLYAALRRFLRLPKGNKYVDPTRSKAWAKLKMPIKMYLQDFVKLLSLVASDSIVTVLLKHVHQLVLFFPTFTAIAKSLIRRLIAFWCTGEETVRVLSFLCIVRITRRAKGDLLEPVLKQTYLSYVRNVKFTSPSTWPVINFMRRSLVEIFALTETVAYHYTFVYIRQLAISLRNAIVLMKQEAVKAVYNWQYVHSVHLWAAVLGTLHTSTTMRSLIYPLTQVIIGTLKLVPTSRYYPLRFHLVRILISLSAESGVFIPVLPFLLDILNTFNFNKPHSKVSVKPFDFNCMLRVSKSQMQENAFKDGLIEHIYELFMEYLNSQAHTMSFPELVLPAVVQLKTFLQKCKVANYSKKMKQILEKINENSQEIEARRGTVTFAISHTKLVQLWESQCRAKGTPLGTFYTSWKRLHEREVEKKISNKEKLDDYTFPLIKQRKRDKIEEEFKNIFASDESEDEEDDKVRFMLKEERATLKRKSGKEGEDEDSPKKVRTEAEIEDKD